MASTSTSTIIPGTVKPTSTPVVTGRIPLNISPWARTPSAAVDMSVK